VEELVKAMEELLEAYLRQRVLVEALVEVSTLDPEEQMTTLRGMEKKARAGSERSDESRESHHVSSRVLRQSNGTGQRTLQPSDRVECA